MPAAAEAGSGQSVRISHEGGRAQSLEPLLLTPRVHISRTQNEVL